MTTHNVKITQTLSRNAKITTEETCLRKAFEDEYYDIKGLIEALRQYIKLDMSKHITERRAQELEVMLISCNQWTEDEYKITKL